MPVGGDGLDEVVVRGTRPGLNPADFGPPTPGEPPGRAQPPGGGGPPPGFDPIPDDPNEPLEEVGVSARRPWWQWASAGLAAVFAAPAPKRAPRRRAPPRRSPPKPKPRRTPRVRPVRPAPMTPGGPNLSPFKFGGALSLLVLLGNKAYELLSDASDARVRQLIGPAPPPPPEPPDYGAPPAWADADLDEVTVSAPRTRAQPVPLPGLIPNLVGAPTATPFRPPAPIPLPQPRPLPSNPTTAYPFSVPRIWELPDLPLPFPGRVPEPFFAPLPSPRPVPRPAPVPTVGLTPFRTPGIDSLPTPTEQPVPEALPKNECAPTPKKDRKKSAGRTKCYKGSYREKRRGLIKRRREEIPCE